MDCTPLPLFNREAENSDEKGQGKNGQVITIQDNADDNADDTIAGPSSHVSSHLFGKCIPRSRLPPKLVFFFGESSSESVNADARALDGLHQNQSMQTPMP